MWQNWNLHCYGLNFLHPNSYVESFTPNVTVFGGERAFQRQRLTITFLCPRFYIPLSTPLLRLRALCPAYRLQAPILCALLQRLPTITPLLPSLHVLLWMARPEVKFLWVQARELIQAHLPSKLAGVAYHPALCAHLCRDPGPGQDCHPALLQASVLCQHREQGTGRRGGLQRVPVGPACRQLCHLPLREPHALQHGTGACHLFGVEPCGMKGLGPSWGPVY